MSSTHVHFVTGRLAQHALREVVADLARQQEFSYSIGVLPITVAALMTPQWIARHIDVPAETDEIILPGYCDGDLQPLIDVVRVPLRVGPRDLRRLPEFFGRESQLDDYGRHDIQIIAEINHAPRLSLEDFVAEGRRLALEGADLIDVGCEPDSTWSRIGDYVRALRDEGLRVSVDSLNPNEIQPAVEAGAELVLSVNETNREAAPDWGCEVVVIPDDLATLGGLEETIDHLAARQVPLRIDPILEPIGFGFAASLQRYMGVRQEYPDAEMMMGIGNLTELTDVDSAGVNVILLAICHELRIRSVLTTQVINWARTSVRECDLARRLVAYAIDRRVPPKHLEPNLVCLRDPALDSYGPQQLAQLAGDIRDHNYRIFAEAGELHVMNGDVHLTDTDPFELFDRLFRGEGQASPPKNLDAGHAFYLGYELAKAVTALTLGKQYRQDEALHWGYLTQPEVSHRHRTQQRQKEQREKERRAQESPRPTSSDDPPTSKESV